MSAHHYFRDFAYCDSGMIPWLLVAELISVENKSLSRLINERQQAYPCSEANHLPGVTYIRGSTAQIDELIDFTPDYIYHLGEYSRVEQSFDDIEKVWEFNKQGIFAVLQFCSSAVL